MKVKDVYKTLDHIVNDSDKLRVRHVPKNDADYLSSQKLIELMSKSDYDSKSEIASKKEGLKLQYTELKNRTDEYKSQYSRLSSRLDSSLFVLVSVIRNFGYKEIDTLEEQKDDLNNLYKSLSNSKETIRTELEASQKANETIKGYIPSDAGFYVKPTNLANQTIKELSFYMTEESDLARKIRNSSFTEYISEKAKAKEMISKHTSFSRRNGRRRSSVNTSSLMQETTSNNDGSLAYSLLLASAVMLDSEPTKFSGGGGLFDGGGASDSFNSSSYDCGSSYDSGSSSSSDSGSCGGGCD